MIESLKQMLERQSCDLKRTQLELQTVTKENHDLKAFMEVT